MSGHENGGQSAEKDAGLTMTSGEWMEALAHAWDMGWRAHMDYLAAVTVWNASEGSETPEALHSRNPYRVRSVIPSARGE